MANNTAVIVCRVSTEDQQRYSPKIQEKYCLRYCEKQKLKVTRVFSFTESGWKKKKKFFYDVVDFIKKEGIGHLVSINEERLCRDTRSFVILNDLVEENSLKIHFVEANEIIDGTDHNKIFIWEIKVAMARKFIADLQLKCRRGVWGRLEARKHLGYAPLGYANKNGNLEKDSERASLVPKLFEYYDSGNYSFRTLADRLYQEGLRTRRGGKISAATISESLRNPVYIGFIKNPYGEIIEGIHAPLVEKNLFQRVQRKLAERAHPHPMKDRWFPFRGLMRCPCGHWFTAVEKPGNLIYYFCATCGGGKPYYREERINELFEAELSQFKFDKDFVDWVKSVLRSTSIDNRGVRDKEQHRLHAEYDRCQAKLDRIVDERLEDFIDTETLKRKASELKVQQATVSQQLAVLEKRNENYVEEGVLILDMVQNLPQTFARANAEGKNRILKLLLDSCIVDDGRLKIVWKEPFDKIYQLNNPMRRRSLSNREKRLSNLRLTPN